MLPALVQANAAQDVFGAAAAQGNADYFPLMSGQSVGLLDDLTGAAEVAQAIADEARAVMDSLAERIKE